MANNSINYLSRDFDSIRKDIIAYAKQNYPQLSDNFGNDTSISSFIVDILSDCVDSLNYHIDRTFQNTQLNTTTSRKALLNIARVNGLKVPGRKAGMCEVKFSCTLPMNNGEGGNISEPNWKYAPVIQRNCVVGTGNLSYTIDENVDFRTQFNSNAFSNRTYEPNRNVNGEITSYTVTKSVVATAGQRRVYKKILSEGDVVPFMEVILPDVDVMNVESIIFKANSNLKIMPEISEYYVDEEEFSFRNNTVPTYRFFETQSLTDQWRWGTAMTKMDDGVISDIYEPDSYVDYVMSGDSISSTTRYYVGGWKPLKQKFITEFTDNGYLKVIFGPGVNYKDIPSDGDNYTQWKMSKIMNNDMLGVLPKVGWTMYILYNVGGGTETNVAAGAINTIKSVQVDFPELPNETDAQVKKNNALKSLRVINSTPSITGKDEPSTDELKYLIKYNTSAQERCVTVKDYETRLMMMPPKYGAPFRCSGLEENNKIVLNLLGMDYNGALYKAVPNTLAENIENYLSHYKSIGDFVEIRSGKIYNIGFLIDAFIDKSYNAADVISSIIKVVRECLDVNKHLMGEDIFIGDLYKKISDLDGVIGLIDLRAYKINGGSYSKDVCPLPSIEDTTYSECNTEVEPGFLIEGAITQRIDLDAVDSVLIGDCNAMYEIKNPNIDIKVRVKQK